MSAMQQLRNSGLFDEGKPQENGDVHFQVKGKYGATIYVTGNEREIQIRDGALQKNRFPNNKRLYDSCVAVRMAQRVAKGTQLMPIGSIANTSRKSLR